MYILLYYLHCNVIRTKVGNLHSRQAVGGVWSAGCAQGGAAGPPTRDASFRSAVWNSGFDQKLVSNELVCMCTCMQVKQAMVHHCHRYHINTDLCSWFFVLPVDTDMLTPVHLWACSVDTAAPVSMLVVPVRVLTWLGIDDIYYIPIYCNIWFAGMYVCVYRYGISSVVSCDLLVLFFVQMGPAALAPPIVPRNCGDIESLLQRLARVFCDGSSTCGPTRRLDGWQVRSTCTVCTPSIVYFNISPSWPCLPVPASH